MHLPGPIHAETSTQGFIILLNENTTSVNGLEWDRVKSREEKKHRFRFYCATKEDCAVFSGLNRQERRGEPLYNLECHPHLLNSQHFSLTPGYLEKESWQGAMIDVFCIGGDIFTFYY